MARTIIASANLRSISLALALLSSTACTQVAWRTYTTTEVPQPGNDRFLKLHMPDGRLYVLSPWRVDSENVIGHGLLYDRDRNKPVAGDFSVRVKDIAMVEVDAPEAIQNRDRTIAAAVTTVVGSAVAVVLGFVIYFAATFHLEGDVLPSP